MVNNIRREAGDGGAIIYAMIWFTILFAFMMFFFSQFNCNVYIAKAEMEMGLHVVEGSVMTGSQRYYQGSELKDDFERDLDRAHIVTAGIKRDKLSTYGKITESLASGGTAMTADEIAQCGKIGNQVTEDLVKQFYLDSNNEPTGGGVALLSSLRHSGTRLLIDGYVTIYEPIYEYDIVRTETGDVSKPYEFVENGTIIGWAEYDMYFDDNSYDHTVKKVLTGTPVLANGNTCEGATIEMTIKTTFYGVNSWFAAASETTTHHNDVSVTQATDIVHVTLDSRKH